MTTTAHLCRADGVRGAWDLSDRAIDHTAIQKAAHWKRAASEAVLIGLLRPDDPGEGSKVRYLACREDVVSAVAVASSGSRNQ